MKIVSNMKKEIVEYIKEYIEEYQRRDSIATQYGQPLIGFADAWHPYIQNLPKLISTSHDLPQDVLPDAKTIIAYFIPFTKELANTNRVQSAAAFAAQNGAFAGTNPDGFSLASPEWARAYEETNALFAELNAALIDFIHAKAGHAGITPKATTFDQQLLISDWSQRHIAFAAGLGTFGLNNMLITKHGCCGRYSTVITNLDLKPDAPVEGEYCLYKKNGSCGICVKNCPTGALTTDGYDRVKCYALCKENAKIYTKFGSSYTGEDGTSANSIGSEVCGKCVTGSPCAFWKLK